jgi:hypothetical protein
LGDTGSLGYTARPPQNNIINKKKKKKKVSGETGTFVQRCGECAVAVENGKAFLKNQQ